MTSEKEQKKVTIKCPECDEKQEFDLKNLETLSHYEPCNVKCKGCGEVYWVSRISDAGNQLLKEAREHLSLPDMFLTVCTEDFVLLITPAVPVPEPEEEEGMEI
jgi:hypothetical protein